MGEKGREIKRGQEMKQKQGVGGEVNGVQAVGGVRGAEE